MANKTDWLNVIHNSHGYFTSKTKGLAPNKLLLHPRVRLEIINKVLEYDAFTICDRGVTQFMGAQVIETVHVKEFNWAYVVED